MVNIAHPTKNVKWALRIPHLCACENAPTPCYGKAISAGTLSLPQNVRIALPLQDY